MLATVRLIANIPVGNRRSPRGCAKFSTWRRNKTSEESNETSEEMIRLHVENKKYPRGDFKFSTWILAISR